MILIFSWLISFCTLFENYPNNYLYNVNIIIKKPKYEKSDYKIYGFAFDHKIWNHLNIVINKVKNYYYCVFQNIHVIIMFVLIYFYRWMNFQGIILKIIKDVKGNGNCAIMKTKIFNINFK